MNWIVMLNEFGSPFFGLFTTFAFTWADIEDGVCLHYNRWDIVPDFSAVDAIEVPVIPTTIESSAATVFVNSPLIPSMDSRYIFFTNGSLISLGTPDVSIGWSWMQIAHSGNYLNDFAVANTAYTSPSSILISGLDLASAHDFVLTYDNNVICESNPRHLLKKRS
ncbi:hypothetical protein GLOIN_2v1783661 [Rhizophagus irregularis DAOM 181602=DAOM 197198]|nr:hypothetical protein GLOIN_2v1783661 [Rhizophagus irregularis DAOM 181602=DAOM 197198]